MQKTRVSCLSGFPGSQPIERNTEGKDKFPGKGHSGTMNNAPESESVRKVRKRKPLLWAIVRTALGLALLYYVTATAVPSLIRHTTDGGKLTWFSKTGIRVLEAYRIPVDYLCVFPPVCSAFEFGSDLWSRLLDPPEKTAPKTSPRR